MNGRHACYHCKFHVIVDTALVDLLLHPRFLQKTVAAFPIVDSRRLQAYLTDQNQTPFAPYALFAAILAHMTTYISEIRAHHKQLWVQVLLAMEDEFRLPRLQTVQLALLILTCKKNHHIFLTHADRSALSPTRHQLWAKHHLDCEGYRCSAADWVACRPDELEIAKMGEKFA